MPLNQLEAKLSGELLDAIAQEASTALIRCRFFEADNKSVQRTPNPDTRYFEIDPQNTQGKISEYMICDSHSTTNGVTTLVNATRGLPRDASLLLTGSAVRAQSWDAGSPIGVATQAYNDNLLKSYFDGTTPIPTDIIFDGDITYNGDVVFNLSERVPVYANAAARDLAIPVPTNGMEIYNTADGVFQDYVAGAWTNRAAGATPTATNVIQGKLFKADVANQAAATAGVYALVAENLVDSSAGAADFGKIATLDATGKFDMSFISSTISGQTVISGTAGESISAGDAVRMKLDGKMYQATKYLEQGKVHQLANILTNFGSTGFQVALTVPLDNNIVVYLFILSGGVDVLAIAGQWVGERFNYVNSVVIGANWSSGETTMFLNAVKIDSNKLVFVGCDGSSATDRGFAKVLSVNTTSYAITVGAAVEFEAADFTSLLAGICSTGTDKFVVGWIDPLTANSLRVRCATVVGTVITFGTEATASTVAAGGTTIGMSKLDTDKFIINYSDTSGDLRGTACTISGTTITPGASTVMVSGISLQNGIFTAQVETDKFIVGYVNTGDTSPFAGGAYFGHYLVAATVSGTVITTGTPLRTTYWDIQNVYPLVETYETGYVGMVYVADDTDGGYQGNNDRTLSLAFAIISFSGTVPTINKIADLDGLQPFTLNNVTLRFVMKNFSYMGDGRFNFIFTDSNNGTETGTGAFYMVNMADNNFIGFSKDTVILNDPIEVDVLTNSDQSGLSVGKTYWLDDAGALTLQGRVKAGTAISATQILKN